MSPLLVARLLNADGIEEAVTNNLLTPSASMVTHESEFQTATMPATRSPSIRPRRCHGLKLISKSWVFRKILSLW